MCVGDAGNAISILCGNQVTKNRLVDGSAKPCCQMRFMKHEMKEKIFRHIQSKECVYICETSELAERQLFAQTETKWLVARQVMQWANCASAGRLKLCG